MGDLIPFPKRDEPLRVQIAAGDTFVITAQCQGWAHIWQVVPGRCWCGEHYWDGQGDPPPAE